MNTPANATNVVQELPIHFQTLSEQVAIELAIQEAVHTSFDSLSFFDRSLFEMELTVQNASVKKGYVSANLRLTVPEGVTVNKFYSLKTESDSLSLWYPAVAVTKKKTNEMVRREKEKGGHVAFVSNVGLGSNVFEIKLSHIMLEKDVTYSLECTVTTEMRESIQRKILEYTKLGQRNLLVCAVKTFEAINGYNQKRCYTDRVGYSSQTFKQNILQELRKMLSSQIRNNFVSNMNQSENNGAPKIEAKLRAATHGLMDYIVFRSELSSCFPESYDMNGMYRQEYAQYIVSEIKSLYYRQNIIEQLSAQDIILVISWIEHCDAQLNVLSVDSSKCDQPLKIEDFVDDIKLLKVGYQYRVRCQIREWFTNILKRDTYIFQDSEGLYISRDPEDFQTLISMQLSVANESFSSSFVAELKDVFIDELHSVVVQMKTNLDENWRKMDIEVLCSIINDSSKMYEKCELMFAIDEQNNELEIQINELCSKFIELSIYATNRLATLLHFDLKDPVILSRIFTQKWEEGDMTMDVVTETLRDYFNDLRAWIPFYFFSKCVRQCFEQVIQSYVEICFHNRKAKLHDSARSSQQVSRDRICLLDLLQKQNLSLKDRQDVVGRLEIFKSISQLISLIDPEDAHQTINMVLRDLGNEPGIYAISSLLKMRKDISKDHFPKWRSIIELVAQLRALDVSENGHNPKYYLPYALHIIAPVKYENEALKSKEECHHINNMYTQVKVPMPLKINKLAQKLKSWRNSSNKKEGPGKSTLDKTIVGHKSKIIGFNRVKAISSTKRNFRL